MDASRSEWSGRILDRTGCKTKDGTGSAPVGDRAFVAGAEVDHPADQRGVRGGEAVAVENLSSRRVVSGIAQAGGEVWVR